MEKGRAAFVLVCRFVGCCISELVAKELGHGSNDIIMAYPHAKQ